VRFYGADIIFKVLNHFFLYDRSIGVSNFSPGELRELLEIAKVKPVVNQVSSLGYKHLNRSNTLPRSAFIPISIGIIFLLWNSVKKKAL
jgi:hypothetical protein